MQPLWQDLDRALADSLAAEAEAGWAALAEALAALLDAGRPGQRCDGVAVLDVQLGAGVVVTGYAWRADQVVEPLRLEAELDEGRPYARALRVGDGDARSREDLERDWRRGRLEHGEWRVVAERE